jgi:hypothetical protein
MREPPERPRPQQNKGSGKNKTRSPSPERPSRPQQNKGIGKNKTCPSDAGELTHGRMMRLLKLLQRSKSFTPDKAVLNRWNDFCDKSVPYGPNNRPLRDPKQIDMESIIRFLLELPKMFWPALVKKLQGQGRDLGLSHMWNDFCDKNGPQLKDQAGKSLRDPRQLDPELLLAFISSTVEMGGEVGDLTAQIIDEFSFDFADERQPPRDEPRHERQQPRDDRRDHYDERRDYNEEDRHDSRRDKGGKGSDKDEDGKGKGKRKNNVNGEDRAFTELIYLDCETLDPKFPFGSRVIGKEGRNVKHIREETGASIWLGGRGSGRLEPDTKEESPKPQHIKVTADDRDGLERALKIAEDLVDSVRQDYYNWLDDRDRGPKRRADEDDGMHKRQRYD